MRALLFLVIAGAGFAQTLVVEKPNFSGKIILRIVRTYPDSFETYRLTNHNGRDMQLVCSKNRAYDDNALPFVEYRNYYNEKIRFNLPSESACRELGRFIELVSSAIDEDRPLMMELSKESVSVTRIQYPNIDPYADDGELEDLLPKKKVRVFEGLKEIKKPLN